MRYDLFSGKGAISKFLLERKESLWHVGVGREIVGCYCHVESGGPILTAGSEGGHILTPRWAGGWTCTIHPGVFGLMPKREEPGKTGHRVVQLCRIN